MELNEPFSKRIHETQIITPGQEKPETFTALKPIEPLTPSPAGDLSCNFTPTVLVVPIRLPVLMVPIKSYKMDNLPTQY